MLSQLERKGLTGQAAADDQDVERLHEGNDLVGGPKLYHCETGWGKASRRMNYFNSSRSPV